MRLDIIGATWGKKTSTNSLSQIRFPVAVLPTGERLF